MKKILLLSILCLLMTGCTINYNLEINEDSFKETITGNVLNEEMQLEENQTDVNIFDYLINYEQSALNNIENSLYNKTINKNTNSIDYNYSFTYNEKNINNSKVLNECFENFKFDNIDNKYYFIANGDFYCNYAEEVKINIITDYKVIVNNANKIKGNIYTWTISRNDIEDLELYMTIDKNEQNKKLFIPWGPLKTIGLIILIILSGICIYFLKREEKK